MISQSTKIKTGKACLVIGIVLSLFMLIWSIGTSFGISQHGSKISDWFLFSLILITFFNLIGLIVAWWMPLIGAIIIFLCSIGTIIRTYFTGQIIGWTVEIILYLVASILLISAYCLAVNKTMK